MSKNECQELKNIKYKTMLLNGNIVENEKTARRFIKKVSSVWL